MLAQNRLSPRDSLTLSHIAALLQLLLIAQTISRMSTSGSQRVKAVWTETETETLIDFIHEHKSQGGGSGPFKTAMWSAAADHLSPLLKEGLPKTADICSQKWQSVHCCSTTHHCIAQTTLLWCLSAIQNALGHREGGMD